MPPKPITRNFAKQGTEKLTAADPEIERTYQKKARQQRQKAAEEEPSTKMAEEQPNPQPILPRPMRLKDHTLPNATDFHSSIVEPQVNTQNFELKPGLIQMIQQSQFGGTPQENPNVHISKFLQLCNTLRMQGVSEEAIRLRLFPFSLRDRASEWLMSMPPRSFNSWEELSSAFLAKYFPPAKTARIRQEINNFTQRDGESLHESWERLKDLLRQCPHHGVPEWLVVENFYNGLDQSWRNLIDSAAGGSLMGKTDQEAFELIENMAMHNYQYGNVRGNSRRSGIYEIETMNQINSKIDQLSKTLERMQMKPVAAASIVCEMCGGEGHQISECMSYAQSQGYEQVNAISNNSFNPRPTGNPYSNTYNPGWRNHPNFSWSNQNQNMSNQNIAQNNRPPGFQRNFNSQNIQNQLPPQNQKSHLEELFENFLVEHKRSSDATQQQIQQLTTGMEQLRTHNRMLENQIAQQALGNTQQRNQSRLPSQTEKNPQGELCAITLRSGKQLEDKTTESSQEQAKETVQTKQKEESYTHAPDPEEKPYVPPPPYKPPIPFPQRIQKSRSEKQFAKFLSTLQNLSITIPFIEALKEMPSYTKFLKEILSNKQKWEEYGTIALTEKCSAILQNKLPQKLKDPGSFSIPCLVGSIPINNALCDLGASVSMIPLSICKKLKMGTPKQTNLSLRLADQSIKHPVGIIEDIPVKIGKLYIPVDFVVMEMEENLQMPIILGRPFLATAGAIIDVKKGQLTFTVGDEKVEFNLFNASKFSEESCMQIDSVEGTHQQTPLEHHKQNFKDQQLKDKAPQGCQETKQNKTKTEHEKHKREFKKGDTVLLLHSCFKLFAGNPKAEWSGPFKVLQTFSHGAVEIWSKNSGALKVNGDRLKAYIDGEWIRKGKLYSFSPP